MLSAGGLRDHLEKCHFLKRKVHDLGYVVSSDGVQTDQTKIECVLN